MCDGKVVQKQKGSNQKTENVKVHVPRLSLAQDWQLSHTNPQEGTNSLLLQPCEAAAPQHLILHSVLSHKTQYSMIQHDTGLAQWHAHEYQ